MKILIIKDCEYKKGQIVDVDKVKAKSLVSGGQAIYKNKMLISEVSNVYNTR